MVCRVVSAPHLLYTLLQVHYAAYTMRMDVACLSLCSKLETYVSYVAPWRSELHPRRYAAVWDPATDLLRSKRFSVDVSPR